MTAGSFPAVSSFQALFRPTGQHGVSVLPAGKLKKQAIAKAITRCLRHMGGYQDEMIQMIFHTICAPACATME